MLRYMILLIRKYFDILLVIDSLDCRLWIIIDPTMGSKVDVSLYVYKISLRTAILNM